ncbi:ubiquitin-conjugating enzyme/RWD-like protein [Aspergillus karnatakaensis]|uniref:putative ubiquitin-conjugating enzyme n=1 Tax=Aspergillus karnatakaensis TaxID=1810916 RepID=UPI003CCD61FC
MSTTRLPNIPSLRRHQLLQEYASLKHAAPPGVYVSLSPGDPTFWACVIFIRAGPYASAILRFQIRFPPSYPDRPPLVTFSTDVFHPLIVPLTTYTFSTGVSNEDPVSATDEERLPPGGFSLRHAFPHWFGRARRIDGSSAASLRAVSSESSNDKGSETIAPNNSTQESADSKPDGAEGVDEVNGSQTAHAAPAEIALTTRTTVPVLEILNYIRTSFDDETVLDSVSLEAAGNPSAWHAWKAHRKDTDTAVLDRAKRDNPQTRLPGDWNWDGIWIRRVQYEVEASRSDATLFGSATRGVADELIHFNRLDRDTLASVKQMVIPPVEQALE